MGGVSAALRGRRKKKNAEPEIPKALLMAKPISICVLGQQKVGKSSLVLKYYMGTYFENFEACESSFTKICEIRGKTEQLVITDSVGYENLTKDEADKLILSSDAIIMAYSIMSPSSFKLILPIFDHILITKNKDRRFPVVLVACQTDNEFKRCVTKDDGEKLARDLGCGFFETSAALDVAIHEPFKYLGEKTIEKREIEKYNEELEMNPIKNKKNKDKKNTNNNNNDHDDREII